jgi:hypothetical protein
MRTLMLFSMSLAVFAFTAACSNDPTYPYAEGRVTFEYPPLDLAGAGSYIGIGQPGVLPKAHGGFMLSNPYTFPASVPVFAVADGVILRVGRGTRHVTHLDAPPALIGQSYDDWALEIRVSTTMRANYGHITELHPAIRARVGDPPADDVGRSAFIEVKAGDTLGFVGPHPALDFAVTDRALALQFLNPSRYPTDFVYGASGFDYFTPAIRSDILAITTRQVPPRAGRHDYDVDGRIVGNWFREGTTSFIQWSRQLAIVYHHVDGDRILISDGSPMLDVPGFEDPGSPNWWFVRGNAPRPEDVGESDGMIKYDLITPFFNGPEAANPTLGVMLVQMTATRKLRVEVFEGVMPGDVTGFTAAAKMYER